MGKEGKDGKVVGLLLPEPVEGLTDFDTLALRQAQGIMCTTSCNPCRDHHPLVSR